MKQAPLLRKGDKIGIVAPARKISREKLQPAIDVFSSWGLEAVLSKNLFGEQNQFSGSDEQRAADIQAFLDDSTIKAIISARGGYGTLRIIDRLDFTKFKKDPKWIIGFSDITVLHSHIHNMGIETLHADMPVNFGRDAASMETLRKALFGEKLSYEFASHPLNRNGVCSGQVVGGNLSLLYALTGSASDIDTKGKILFLEDLDEYLYHVDRMLLNLERSGKLSGLAGLVIGGMTDMKDNNIPFGKNAEEIIADAVKKYKYPLCFGFPAGHILNNSALLLGRKAELKVSSKGSALEY